MSLDDANILKLSVESGGMKQHDLCLAPAHEGLLVHFSIESSLIHEYISR